MFLNIYPFYYKYYKISVSVKYYKHYKIFIVSVGHLDTKIILTENIL